MENIPDLLNPVVKPLMESIKRERCQIIQQLAAQYLVKLLDLVRNRNPNPINKIVINLCRLLKSDLEFTPRIVSMLFSEHILQLFHVFTYFIFCFRSLRINPLQTLAITKLIQTNKILIMGCLH